MKKIIISKGDAPPREHALSEGTASIGRRKDCTITIEDSASSGRHANFITVLDDVFVEDCGSSNGTYVGTQKDRKKISRTRLQHNDVITIGTHTITYADEVSADLDPDFCKAAVYLPTSPAAAAAIIKIAEQTVDAHNQTLSVPQGGWGSAPEGTLTLTGKVANGKKIKLTRSVVAIGNPRQQLAAVSRWQHGYFLSHIGSDRDGKRYPLLDSEPVPTAAKLCNNSKINLVGLELVFNI